MFYKSFQNALKPLEEAITDLVSKKVPQCHHTTKDLIREVLHGWKYSDIKDEHLSMDNTIAQEDHILGSYDNYLKPLLNELLKQSIEFSIKNSENWDQILFSRSDEIVSSWNLLDNVLTAWKNEGNISLYEDGGWGPEEADKLIEKDGKKWIT